MSATVLQTTGFVSGAIGTVGVLAATVMEVWCTEDQEENKATSNHHYMGLWKDCEVSQNGLTECQPLNSYLSYSRILQAIRALMIVAILVGVIAVFIGFFCLKCLNMRSMDLLTKGKLVLSAGILFIIAGIFDISGSSVYADQIVPSFMMQYPTQYNQKYTFGPALYVAWVGGVLLILGGILKCIAFNTIFKKLSYKYDIYRPIFQYF
uniref:Claudin n=1 Tax=Cyprinus carpio TaxID=7962 RepID=A0A8C1WNU0_CYPCA